MDYNRQENKENERDLYRICPSQLTKHELEDLYFTVLDTNIQLRKTIQGQESKIKQLSNKLQRKVAAQKVLEAEEFKDCCVITKTKLRQQKESLAQLRRAHDKTAERIRRINVKLSSEKTQQPSLPRCIRCEPETSSFSRSLKNSPSYLTRQRQAQANPKTAIASANLRSRVIIMNSVATQTEMPRYNVNTKSNETQTNTAVESTEIESTEAQNVSLTDKDTDNSIVSQKESFKNNTKNGTTQTESLDYKINTKSIRDEIGSARTTQTELSNSIMNNVITRSIQVQTDPIIDNLSTERHFESASYKNYKLNNYQHNGLCDENKCRTHINELKQKISKLVAELDKTHYMYSTRIGRLEVELQEYRNTNVHEHQYENCMNQLVNNLREANILGTELKEQRAVEKVKVAELVDLIKSIKMSYRATRAIPQPLVNIDSQNYKSGRKQDTTACTCCSETNMRINSDKCEPKIANKKQGLIDGKKGVEVSNTLTQQNTSKIETVENLPEMRNIQDTKTDGNILNFTIPKSTADGSKIFRNIYWNPKTHHASDAFPIRNDGVVNQNSTVRDSDQQLQDNENSLETTKKGSSKDKNNMKPIVNNIVNASDVITRESLRDSNINLDNDTQELSQVQDIAVTSVNQGPTEIAKNRNLAVTEFNPDFKSSGIKTRKNYDLNNDSGGRTGEKGTKDFDPNILASSLASVAEKQKSQMIDASNLMEASSCLIRQDGELLLPQMERLTEVLFKDSKVEMPVNDSAKPVENKPCSDQKATTLNSKPEAQSKTTDNIDTKPTIYMKSERRNSQQIHSPTPTFISVESSRNADLLNLVAETSIHREEKGQTEHTKSKDIADEIRINSEEKRRKENTKTKDIPDEIRSNSKDKRRKENTKTKETADEIRTSSEEKQRKENTKANDITDEIRITSDEKQRKENVKTKDIPNEIRINSEEKRRTENTKTKDIADEISITSEEKRWIENAKTKDVSAEIRTSSEEKQRKENIKTNDITDEIKIASDEKRRKENNTTKDTPDEIKINSEEKRRKENTKNEIADEIRITGDEKRRKDITKTKDIADEIRINSEEKRRKENTKTKDITEEIKITSDEKRRNENTRTKDIPDEIRTNSEQKRRIENTKTKGIPEEIRIDSEEKRRKENSKTKDISDEISTSNEEKRLKEINKTKDIADEIKLTSDENRRNENSRTKDISDEIRISVEEKRRKENTKAKDIADNTIINSDEKRLKVITKTKDIANEAQSNREEIGQKDNTTIKEVTAEAKTKREEKELKEDIKTKDITNETRINREETAQKEVSKIDESTTSSKKYKYTSKNNQNIANKSKYDYQTSSASQTDRRTYSLNNYYSPGEGVNTLETPWDIVPEKLDIQKDTKNIDVPIKTQREISMYRRNSGTLCFTTTPGAERLHCECGKRTLCGGLINKDTQLKYEIKDISKNEHGTCITGCDVCRSTSPENRGDQVLTSIVKSEITHYVYTPEDTSSPSDNRRPSMLTNINNNNPLRNAEEVATSKAKSTSNNNDVKLAEEVREPMEERHTTRLDGTQGVENTVGDLTEELASCKHLLQTEHINSSALAESQKALNEFDTVRQLALKRGVAKHIINEEYSSKCMFVLHIGTVVLSDEAVLNSRDKSLVLLWKFYDQNVTMTQMPAGRVVLFDFSTEYQMKMTDEFLNYMKNGELRILICEMDKPHQPIASCTLPLRDALLNTNRRADMSLALIAGPETYDQTANRRISDRLDSRDEMGVLDLWCMLHAEANLAPVINVAIAQQSKFVTDQATDILDSKNVLQQVTEDKNSATESQDIAIPFSNSYNKPKHSSNGKRLSLHRWGSSVLRLPSREASQEVSEDDPTATLESVSIKGKHYDISAGPTNAEMDTSFPISKDHKCTQAQDLKLKSQKRDTNRKTSIEYDPSKYPSTGRNSGTRSTNDYNMQSKDISVGPTNEELDTSFPIISEDTANIKCSDDMKRVMYHKCTQAQDMKLKSQKRDTNPKTPIEYDPSKYPSTGRNSGTRSANNYNIQSKDISVGPTNAEMDTSFPIIIEDTASIKSLGDMKRVMYRSSLPARSRVSKGETSVRQDAFLESQMVRASRTATQEMAKLKKARQQRETLKEAANKRRNDAMDFISMRPDSVILPKPPSDTSNINKKYDNIAKTFIRTEDPSKKQVTIKANHGSISEESPQRDQDSNEEEQTVDITILWLALNEECEAMLNPRVQRVYVAYEFLGRSGADMETPISLPKPKHYVEKCYFNFKKTFVLEKEDIPVLSHMIRCRAASKIPRSNKDCIVFTVISEPPEDPLGLEICEDIGYANLFLGDLLAYGVGSPGYTEVIPVRSRYGTSICGVLAVRLDGLDVLRQYFSLVNEQTFFPQIN